MAALSWGKCKIWIAPIEDGLVGSWISIPTPAEGTTSLATTKGDKKEAKVEGGENEAVIYNKSTYALEFEIRASKGRTKPVEDKDGVIDGEYAVRLQPEDASVQGIYIPRAVLSMEASFSTDEGAKWKYTADAVVPFDLTSAVKFKVLAEPLAQLNAVTYDANGGTGTEVDSSSPYAEGATVTAKTCTLTAPSGKEFDKWNTAPDGSGKDIDESDEFVIHDDVKLFAIWKASTI